MTDQLRLVYHSYDARKQYRFVAAAAVIAILGVVNPGAAATGLPPGFQDATVASGLSAPTAMDFAPDGRLFVTQQTGELRVIKNGVLLPTPFLTLTVDSSGERGLLGIALDPSFASNHYVYVYYTATTPAAHNRISRFTANGDVRDTSVPEVILLDFDNLSATNHNGGGLHFGPDGKLYAAHGENAVGSNAQSLNNLLGKIIRMNPVPDPTAQVPTDNPFYGVATGKNRLIWLLGLRNPFTFAFQPGTGRALVNDVGQSTWEEINEAIAGHNYGWPTTEGAFTGHPEFTNPIYSYAHSGNAPTGCAITGGAFYNPSIPRFPSSYIGKYFFSDLCSNWIYYIDPNNPANAAQFAASIPGPVDLKVGSDGALYYLARNSGIVGKIEMLGFTPNAPGSGDFDGDAKADVTVFRPSDGNWFILKSSSGYSTWDIRSWGVNGDVPVPGDYDGDGKADLAVYRPSNGTWYLLKSSTNYSTWIVFQWGISGDVPEPGDYDGDGKTDMAVYRPSTSYWYLLKSSTNFATWIVFQWGLNGDVPVPGDYDGDGKTDVAVYRPSTGYWYLLQSSTNFATWVVCQWGLNGDVPVPGDYDGDGRIDMAVYRPLTGYWYLLKSSTNFATWIVFQWGLNSDVPVPGDYDGDGRTDMAVYRPLTGYWYLLKSSTSFATWSVYQWGIAGDTPVF